MKKNKKNFAFKLSKKKNEIYETYEIIKNLVKLILQLNFKFQTFLLKLRIQTIYKFIEK